jgi:4'-phosphopantetheinyl transferase
VTAARAAEAVASGEVRVWTVPVGEPLTDSARLSVLSDAERARAGRFRFERDRNRFVACRVALREILGRALRTPPADLHFEYGANGKPALASRKREVEFNVSHRMDVAVIAVTRGRRVGIDVEPLRPVEDPDALAARFFSEREAAALRAVSPEKRDEAFLACWTRKEAFVKALGAGLSLPLDSFSVSLEPGAPPAVLAWQGRDAERGAWTLRSWRPAPGYLAAIAVEGADWRLRRQRFTSSPGSPDA